MISEGSCLVVWHPEKPDRIWAHGGPRHWQTDDGGRNWRPANGYFNGKQHQNWFIDQMFDPADPDRFGYFMTDFGVGLTTNGGLWFDRGRMVTRKLDLIHGTVNGGALHPDPARRTILASVGKMNAGKLVLSQDDGATWRVASDGERRRQYVGFDLDDPRYAYQWRERSTDHGATWSEMPALPRGFAVSGMTLTAEDMAAGQAIFATDRDAGGRNCRILRSLDRGESWTRFADSPFDFGVDGMTGGGPCRAHPSDPDVFFTKGPNGWTIRKWMLGGSPATPTSTSWAASRAGVPPDGMFAVMSLALDRRHPEVMYVASSYDNVPYKFFRSADGGAAWENLTEGFPGVFMRGLEVSPTTGEVFIGSAERLAGAARRPMPTPSPPPARRRRSTSGASATSTPPTEPGGVASVAGPLACSATSRHMALRGRCRGRSGRDAGRGRFQPCDHDAVQRGAAAGATIRCGSIRTGWPGASISSRNTACPRSRRRPRRGFTWIIYFDAATPQPLRDRIEACREIFPFVPYFAGTISAAFWPRSLARRCRRGRTPWLLTTRFDNDDALASRPCRPAAGGGGGGRRPRCAGR